MPGATTIKWDSQSADYFRVPICCNISARMSAQNTTTTIYQVPENKLFYLYNLVFSVENGSGGVGFGAVKHTAADNGLITDFGQYRGVDAGGFCVPMTFHMPIRLHLQHKLRVYSGTAGVLVTVSLHGFEFTP